MRGELTAKRAFVTGGARGLGREICRALAALGAEVTMGVRDLAKAKAAQLALAPHEVQAQLCDMDDPDSLAAALAPGYDILINNAGIISPIAPLADVTPEAFAAHLRTNLVGPMAAIHFALPMMLARGAGTVINISSGAARQPKEGWLAYCTGKAGLAMVTRALALEYGAAGVRAFGFAPGVVDTDMQGEIRASGINEVSRLPRSALRPASDPARAVAWLCTPAADGFIGQEVDVRDPNLRQAAGLDA